MPSSRNDVSSGGGGSQRSPSTRPKRPRADAPHSSNLAALPMTTSTSKTTTTTATAKNADPPSSEDGDKAAAPEQPTKTAAAASATNAPPPMPPSSSSSAAEDRIVRLSEGCRQHRLVHAKRVDVLDELSPIPDDCQVSLDSLATILPRLEAEWRIVTSETSPLLPAVCDFYRSVLSGAFCPHAPHLFRLGRDGSQLFPRVHLLLSHLTSRKVASGCAKLPAAAAHATSPRERPAAAATTTAPTPLLEDIVETATQLLAYIANPILQQSVANDLIDLLADLCDLNCLHRAQPGDGPSRGVGGGPYKAELELLRESRELSASASARPSANPPAPHEEPPPPPPPPFLLAVTVGMETLVLELAVMQILFRLSSRHRRASMESVDEMVILPCGPEQARRHALGVGRWFHHHQAEDELEDLAQTLSAVLSRPFPTPNDVDSASSAAKRAAIVTLRSKMAACDLLEAVVRDAGKSDLPPDAIVILVATSVARACSRCLQLPLEGSGAQRLLLDPAAAYWLGQYRSRLASLLLRLAPIRLGESHVDRNAGVLDLSQQRVLHTVLRPHLLDAASWIVPAQPSAATRAHPDLEIAVLRLLHKTLMAVDGRHAASVVPSQVAHRLVQLLDDPILSVPATFLLAKCTPDPSHDLFTEAADGPPPFADPDGSSRKRRGLTGSGADANVWTKRQKPDARERPMISDGTEDSHLAVLPPPVRISGQCWKDQLAVFAAKAQADSYRLVADIVGPHQDDTKLLPMVNSVMAAIRFLVLSKQPLPTFLTNAVESLVKRVPASNTGDELSNQVARCGAFLTAAAHYRPDSVSQEFQGLFHSAALSNVSFVDQGPRIDSVLAAHLSLHLDTASLPASKGVVVSVSNLSSNSPTIKRIDWFSAVTIDAESQRFRLATLAQLTSQSYRHATSLSEGTVRSLNLTPRDHPIGAVRLLRWQCILWLGLSSDPVALRHLIPLEVGREEIRFFLTTAFADPSPAVREFASRHVGILFREGRRSAAAMTTDEAGWRSFCQQNAENEISFYSNLAARVFSDVDRLLHEYCSVPQSQLSFTVGTLSETKRCKDNNPGKLKATTLQFRRCAMRALASMGSVDSTSETLNRMVFEESLKRVVCLLSTSCTLRRFDSIGLGLGALSLASRRVLIRKHVRGECLPTFTPALFRDVLLPGSSIERNQAGAEASLDGLSQAHRGLQYGVLSHFIQRFCCESSQRTCLQDSNPNIVLRFVELCLPSVVSQFVIENDYGPMLLTTGFKLFLLSVNRVLNQSRRRAVVPTFRGEVLADDVHDDQLAIRGKKSKQRSWTIDLEGQTRHLCLAPVFIEQILPTIFMKAGRSELTFFVRTVLQQRISLQKILTQREQLILKGLVWEAGLSAATTEAGIRAIRAAAVARSASDVSVPDGDKAADTFTEAEEWVSSHFMYLLVNVVQINWSHKQIEERLRALRCLIVMLHFLKSSVAPTFVPQFMATVNASIQLKCNDKTVFELRILAVRALHQFLRIIAMHQWETLGQYLTEIVVSLIPLLPEDGSSGQARLDEPTRLAVSVLEWLTEGALGKKLAPFFAEVPFLPLSTHLDSIRSSLRKNGIDVDSLHVAATQGSQFDSSFRGSHLSDGVSIGSDSLNGRRQAALQNRLSMMCLLLSNENANVRCVALKHMTSLIRGNRDLFCELVTNESVASFAKFLTVLYQNQVKSRGTVTEVMETILERSIVEADQSARVSLAECIGEVGAIDANLLDEDILISHTGSDTSVEHNFWRMSNPPWRSMRVRYEVKLVTSHLVQGLKAAPTSSDQNKIAFCIQQLLVLLDESVRKILAESDRDVEPANRNLLPKSEDRGKMCDWLRTQLTEAGVIEVVEPFWISEFHEVENSSQTKLPPFFQKSSTYFSWMSNWCRHMINRSHEAESPWSPLFYACRTAVRSPAGLSTSEFLLPLFVLDRLCFGNAEDKQVTIGEMREALASPVGGSCSMDWTERQKAVNAVFSVIDTLLLWAEVEKEKSYQDSKKGVSSKEKPAKDSWPEDVATFVIDEEIPKLPLPLRAQAAAKIGMNARALRLVEMAVRESVAGVVFNGREPSNIEIDWKWQRSRAAGSCPGHDLDLLNGILAELQDYETMGALQQDASDPLSSARDSIRFKEAKGDWSGALPDYERALQLSSEGPRDPVLQRGCLRCLLELGQYESVLNQVKGIVYTATTRNESAVDLVLPMGVEAAWRLGRWETLSELVSTGNDLQTKPDTRFQQSVGRVMLGIHEKDFRLVELELTTARTAVMGLLSSSARESYSRAYEHVVKLQSLKEIEDVAPFLCKGPGVKLLDVTVGFGWQRRLELVSSSGMRSVAKTRLALARLAKDEAMEGSLFLQLGQQARKSRLFDLAATCFSQAEAVLISSKQSRLMQSDTAKKLQLQVAKLKHACGESSAALKILSSYDDVESAFGVNQERLLSEVARRISQPSCEGTTIIDKQAISVFVRAALQSTLWMIEGGLKSSDQVKRRFQVIHRLSPEWERGHFQYARYIDGLLDLRIKALLKRVPHNSVQAGPTEQLVRSRVVDKVCQRYILLAMKHYGEAVKLGMKHVFQALPRLLSLWFDFTSLCVSETSAMEPSGKQPNGDDVLRRSLVEANTFMAQNFKQIPAIAFYTAIPQLISRVIHDDKDTAMVVRGILKRVLTKFPAQALWQLGWLRMSRVSDRKAIGESIFADAEKALRDAASKEGAKKANARRIMGNHDLLVASGSLFSHLQKLAQFVPTNPNAVEMKFAPWKGEVELCEFIPPVQAALSASLAVSSNAEPFPRQIPRMRAFDHKVDVMVSKARPKRLKAIAVCSPGPDGSASDIGEYHFLVKHEAKGDLRKDARVQDLNNVINRMMSHSLKAGPRPGHRRLHLRTFTVTVLSEDTGLLEWVPMTQSFRNLVSRTYNPQASTYSSKGRGSRATNFGDHVLRSNFDKAQDMFFKSANLKRAAVMFEELCLKAFPPVLYWWFVQSFADPHCWYEARTRFALSCAVWSGVGHVIGLGDRHSENILVDTSSGACVHVDFDCIFDKGLHLPKPEVIPFRLTQNMLDAFGPTGADGMYSTSLHRTMTTLRENRDTLLSVLEPFVNDPIIDWKRFRSQQKHKVEDRQAREAKRSILVIDERLQGIYNLVNPNLKRLGNLMGRSGAGVDGITGGDDDLQHMVPLTVEGQVHKMISEATSTENLVQQYVGWMPWV